jgi:transposase-like protein
MPHTRKRYSPEFKAQVVLEVLSNTGTLNEIGSKHSVHPVMISNWKKEFLEKSRDIFKDPRKKDDTLREKEQALDEAYKQIGQLSIERDWLKKKYTQLGGV